MQRWFGILAFCAAIAAPAATTGAEAVAGLVEQSVTAYNAGDLGFFEAHLSADAVYIADDGATFAGKERILGLFGRLFSSDTPPQLELLDSSVTEHGDVAWARAQYALRRGEQGRQAVATTIFVRADDGWRIASIQNTPNGHAARH